MRTPSLAVFAASMLLNVTVPTKGDAMTANQKNLSKAQTLIREFEAAKEGKQLRGACLALDDIDLPAERDAKVRAQLRSDALVVWLQLVDILDRSIDPNFNPNELPQMHVLPPRTPDGIQFPPGVDPERIEDAQTRAEYEKALAENDAKTDRYVLQTELGRLSDRIPERAKAFIRHSYKASPEDQQELKAAIEKNIQDPKRKTEFLSVSRPNAAK